jgi:hypothetical protein
LGEKRTPKLRTLMTENSQKQSLRMSDLWKSRLGPTFSMIDAIVFQTA